jgi:hypothetical protein
MGAVSGEIESVHLRLPTICSYVVFHLEVDAWTLHKKIGMTTSADAFMMLLTVTKR